LASSSPHEGGSLAILVAAAAALVAGLAIGARGRAPVPSAAPVADPGCLAGKDNAAPAALAEQGRGREARTPRRIPLRGWRDVLWRTAERAFADRLLAVAAGVAFFALLALFPAVAALVSLYGLFADARTIADHISALSFFLPPSATDIIRGQAERIAAKGSNTLGLTFAVSLGIALWSANAGIKAMFDALNVVYGEREKRGIISFNLETLAFTLGTLVFLLVALAALVLLPATFDLFGEPTSTERLFFLFRWPLLLAGLIVGLSVLYRFGPSRREARWQWVTWGSVVAAFGWAGVSMLFSWYLANLASYNETYGSLGAVIGFMTWLWLSVFVVLVGGELNAELERQTARDTTVGAEKPIGRRGAVVADALGPAKEW
jgi:membrane protein